MVMKDLSWYITKGLYDFVTGLANHTIGGMKQKTDGTPAAEGQQVRVVSVTPTLENGRDSEERAGESDARRQNRGSEERDAQSSRNSRSDSPERTVNDWDAFMKYEDAVTSGRLLTLRFKTQYRDAENASFELTFPLSTHGHDDEEAFLKSVRTYINRAAASSSEEHDRWLGPDRNVAGFLVKLMVPTNSPSFAENESD